MGSSGWYYFASYQENLDAVLTQVRNETFASGNYYHPLIWYHNYVNGLAFSQASVEEQVEARERLQELAAQGLPATIEGLIHNNAESGTHSILDINHVASQTAFFGVAPLSPEVLVKLFGTTKPNHSTVEAHLDVLQGIRFRWCGTYIIIYDNDQACELCFVGNSGD